MKRIPSCPPLSAWFGFSKPEHADVTVNFEQGVKALGFSGLRSPCEHVLEVSQDRPQLEETLQLRQKRICDQGTRRGLGEADVSQS